MAPTSPIRQRLRPVRLRDWTLRGRLIAGFLGLLLITCIGIGLFTELALRRSLTNQLDNQLTTTQAVGGRGGGPGPGRFPGGGDDNGPLLPPGRPVGSVSLQLRGGAIADSAYQPSTGTTPPAITETEVLQSLAQYATSHADGRIRTVALPGLGSYRVVAQAQSDGDARVSGIPLKTIDSTLRNLAWSIVGLSLLALLITGIVGALIVRLALRPLGRITTTASRVAEMSLDEGEVALAERVPEPNPRTEVGQVGVALNRMLDNINAALNARHRSEMRVRQFVADASHELRTPLASIRGYAELTRRSREVAPPDIAHAMSRVESEAGRMTTLVEDLLLLARLDAGRPLDFGEVDLTRLAVDALSDAHAAGPQHRWHLEVPDEPVLVDGDAARLHQVFANLLANARTHTPPGTAVTLSLAVEGDTAIIAVRDDGPGIPASLLPDIFERFTRGEESRSRTAGSTGLGLAIVAAVVAAHHGRIRVTSVPGDTTFTVSLKADGESQAHGDRQGRSQTPASKAHQSI